MSKRTPSLIREIEALRVLSTFSSQKISMRTAAIRFLSSDLGYQLLHLARLSGYDRNYLHLHLLIAEAETEVQEALDTDRLSIRAFKLWFLITPSTQGSGATRTLIPRQDQLSLLWALNRRHRASANYHTCMAPSAERLRELTARIAKLEQQKDQVIRVLGPYKQKDHGWRLTIYDAGGSRKKRRFKTRELAEAAKVQLLTASPLPAPVQSDPASAPAACTLPAPPPSGPTHRSPRSPRPR